LPENLMAGHSAMLELQALVSREARPGKRVGDIFDLALDFVKSKGYATYFMGADDGRVSFIAHGIGLELDEFPLLQPARRWPSRRGWSLPWNPN
jgi:Xaa-Pro dipeptidase